VAGINKVRTLWLLSDGASGHLSQSRGIAEAIGRFCPVRTIEITLQVRRRFLKSLLRFLLPISANLARRLLKVVYRIELPVGRPDLIVSSGGNTLLANALLGEIFAVPNFYSGTLKKYPARCYSRIFSVTSQGSDNNVVLPLPPVPLQLTEKMPLVGPEAPWLLLIGGDGAGYHYTTADWELLAEGINRIARDLGIRWLLTTSRRTGNEAEKVLQARISPDLLEEAVYFGQTPRPVVREFLGRCRGVLVSEDSLTMVAEAIYSGRPVVTLRPRQSQPEGNDALALDGYAGSNLITRHDISGLGELKQLPAASFRQHPDVPELIWQSVRGLLGEGKDVVDARG
jgi:hypothetical protein